MLARPNENNQNIVNLNEVDATFFYSMGLAVEKNKTKKFYDYLDKSKDEFIKRFDQLEEMKRALALLNVAVLNEDSRNKAKKLSEDIAGLIAVSRGFYRKFKSYDKKPFKLHFHKLCKYKDFQIKVLDQHLKKDYVSQPIDENDNFLAKKEHYQVVDTINSGYFREYRVDFHLPALSGSFIEAGNDSSPKIIINAFPSKQEGEAVTDEDLFKARMQYSLAVASQLISICHNKPSKKNPMEFSVYKNPDRIFLYTAIRLLGKHSSLNFDEKSIRIPGDLSGARATQLEEKYKLFINMNQSSIEDVKKDFNLSIEESSKHEVSFYSSIKEAEKITKILLSDKKPNPGGHRQKNPDSISSKFESLETYQRSLDSLNEELRLAQARHQGALQAGQPRI